MSKTGDERMSILNRNQQTEWDKANCPICGKEYQFIGKTYTPKTCGKFSCLQEAKKQGIIK
jgi:hypothetical protein